MVVSKTLAGHYWGFDDESTHDGFDDGGGLLALAGCGHDSMVSSSPADRPPVSSPPKLTRNLGTPIAGDTALLDFVRSKATSPNEAHGVLDEGSVKWDVDVRADGSYSLRSELAAYAERASDHTYVEVTNDQRTAVVTKLPHDPPPKVDDDDGTVRLPTEGPTNNDTLNFMLKPSYVFRLTVEPNVHRDQEPRTRHRQRHQGHQVPDPLRRRRRCQIRQGRLVRLGDIVGDVGTLRDDST